MKAVISGITGQDGYFLAKMLLGEGSEVFGLTRRQNKLGSGLAISSLLKTDYSLGSLKSIITDINPDVIFNLASQSSVGLSWQKPLETMESSAIVLNFLRAIVELKKIPNIRFINASSSEVYQDRGKVKLDELSPIAPRNPYGVSKATGHFLVDAYRSKYGMFAANTILFPHESEFRGTSFLTAKILRGIEEIKFKRRDKILLGNISIVRDWGYAEDYMKAMILQAKYSEPENFNICSGMGVAVSDYISMLFEECGLNAMEHVEHQGDLFRSSEPHFVVGDNRKARELLGWSSNFDIKGMVQKVCENWQKKGGA